MQESNHLTPKQTVFAKAYTDPTSDTFSNATKSGMVAGYSESYSENITHLNPNWLSEYIGKTGVLEQAQQNMLDWVKTEERELLPFKFKASETVLKMMESATSKKEDFWVKLLAKPTLSNYEQRSIAELVRKHRIHVFLPVPPISKEEKERMLSKLR